MERLPTIHLNSPHWSQTTSANNSIIPRAAILSCWRCKISKAEVNIHFLPLKIAANSVLLLQVFSRLYLPCVFADNFNVTMPPRAT